MKYSNAPEGVFISRPNRFIAEVEINGKIERVHVKNTGRCRELLEKGNTVYLCHLPSDARKTAYDLIAVRRRDGKLINMDSYAPNLAAGEWLAAGGIGTLTDLKAEQTVGNSRFDFTASEGEKTVLIEVKGCTLEREGIAYFPDAPTARGLKHVRELEKFAQTGCRCVILIVIQMTDVHCFRANRATDPQFADALRSAHENGVEVIALNCTVVPGEVSILGKIPVDWNA